MIDAANITDYELNKGELEERIIFWILAAGKNGTRAAKIVNLMVDNLKKETYIFDTLRKYTFKELVELCTRYKTGCQTSKAKSIYEIVHSNLDLSTCTPEDLEKIYGIGMKTSRCFIIHSRRNSACAGLDTHMLKHLSSLGYDVPKNTPASKKKYLTLEKIVLKLADKAKMSPAQYDLMIWRQYKVGGEGVKEINL